MVMIDGNATTQNPYTAYSKRKSEPWMASLAERWHPGHDPVHNKGTTASLLHTKPFEVWGTNAAAC